MKENPSVEPYPASNTSSLIRTKFHATQKTIVSPPSPILAWQSGKDERTDVQILGGFHDHAEGDGAVQVELLMRVVEEADGVAGGGEWEEGSVAQTRPCGRVRRGSVGGIID